MHLIELHVPQRIIEVTVSGFWTEAHFDAFVRDLHAAIADFPPGIAPPATLYNYTFAAIQTQAVVARMRALAQHPAMIERRVAMYTEGVLARQQARRVAADRDNMRIFDTRAAALAFLLDAEVDHAAPPPRLPRRSIASVRPAAGARYGTEIKHPD